MKGDMKNSIKIFSLIIIVGVFVGVGITYLAITNEPYDCKWLISFYPYETYLYQIGVPEKEFDNCMSWAFGENWITEDTRNAADLWNQRHSDIFKMSRSDSVEFSIMKIGKAYLDK